MNRPGKKVLASLSLTIALAIFLTPAPLLNASDHGDSPYVSGDQSVDGADLYAFLDPSDNTRVILAMTVRGFITPGQNRNFGQFDPNVRHRFEIDIDGDARPERFIDVVFKKRLGSTTTQDANVTLMDGQTFPATATQPSTCIAGATNCPPAAIVNTFGTTDIRFFAGLRDDTFNLDLPAVSNYFACLSTGTAPTGETCPSPTTNLLQRGRDSFAGYNIMNIVFSIPRAFLTANGVGNSFKVQAVHQRRSPALYPGSPDVVATGNSSAGFGRWQTLDRVGNPGVNTLLIPFARREEYNAATPQDDANGRFAGSIVSVLQSLGTNATNINILAGILVTNGDMLQLNLNTPNTSLGFGEQIYSTSNYSGYPNGRRPHDDVIDTLLFFIANQLSGGRTDNANVNEQPALNTFPFFPPPHQPRPAAAGAEDSTRN